MVSPTAVTFSPDEISEFPKNSRFVEEHTENATAFLLNTKGVELANRDEYEEAKVCFEKALRLNPSYVAAYRNLALVRAHLGLSYSKKGMLNEAIKEYKEALRLNAEYTDILHYNLGVAYRKNNMLDHAVTEFKAALSLNPKYAEAHHNLGVIYYNKGKYEEAFNEFKQAVETKSNYAEAHCGLGACYHKKGLYEKAIEEHEEAIKAKPDLAEAYYNLGLVYCKKKMYERGIACFERAIEIDEKCTDSWFKMAEALKSLGRCEEAKECFERADFEEAVKFFEANREKLAEEYENKFIAIINNKVVDSDEDFPSLAKRVYKKFGYRDICMPKVTRQPEVLRIRTPFLCK